ncbi:MAG: hypothetical protein MK132_04540 [Lentisphaerales bacterium]|nr:hypothetical protein [Lentisphaerales bacterium]
MPYNKFDRKKVKMLPLSERQNKQLFAEKQILPNAESQLSIESAPLISEVVSKVRDAKDNDKPVMLTFGAHSIKNCLAPVFIALLEGGWLSQLATNGAGIIHDWEFAFQGQTSEDVQAYASQGKFGNWQETGFYLNLAINVGTYEGLGYGESVGAFICNEGLEIPSKQALIEEIKQFAVSDSKKSAAAADLLIKINEFDLEEGWLSVPHPFKECSVQAAAYRLGIPFTSHPMIGHDIIYNHAMNSGACIGRAAERDFLTFAENVRQLNGGVYLSVGSAVMSPMVFEKSMSIGRNVEIQEGRNITDHYILIVDLQETHWDWTKGEPPETNPDYYLRYNKSFSRMGGEMRYLSADNRDFLLSLFQNLEKK